MSLSNKRKIPAVLKRGALMASQRRSASVLAEALDTRTLFAGETGLRADYYNNSTGSQFSSTALSVTALPVLTRIEGVPGSSLKNTQSSPGAGVNNDFSVRWSGQVKAVEGGTYKFRANADDGIRIWVNGTQVYTDWSNHGPRTSGTQTAVTLMANTLYDIRID